MNLLWKSTWHIMAARRYVWATRWDMSEPLNRRGLRRAWRQLWEANHGRTVSVVVGATTGVAMGVAIALLSEGILR